MKHYNVVAAIIMDGEKILCVQRGAGKYDYISYKWEFPGGKVEEGESADMALIREIKEELNIEIEVSEEFLTINHSYPDFSITMASFLCKIKSGDLKLNEHKDSEWLVKNELVKLDWAQADVPIVENLLRM